MTRKAGHDETWRFEDRNWKTHPEWADYGEPEPYAGRVPEHLRTLPQGVGFTRIELTQLVPTRRYNLATLRLLLGNTYRRLITGGAVMIKLNGDTIAPMELPLSTAFEKRAIDVKLRSGRRIRGWIGRLDRDAVRSPLYRIPGGMRLLYQGRLIADGEYFGHRAEGKGLLASLIGEVELNHLEPLSNKTGFQKGTAEWEEVEQAMHAWLAPIIAIFRRAVDEQPITREERKRASAVRRQLQEALQDALRHVPTAPGGDGGDRGPSVDEDSGRRRPALGEPLVGSRAEHATTRRPPEPRTPAPDDAVGTLRRLRRRLGERQEVPPIVLVDADTTVRSDSERGPDGRVLRVAINRQYALYKDLHGDEAYLAETSLLELLQPDEVERMHPREYIAQVNQCLDLWHRVATAPPSQEAA